MFFLQDLPDRRYVERFAKRYGPVSHDRLLLFLGIMRCGSDLLVELDNFLEDYGLTHGRWITLVLLMRQDDQTARPVDLAEKQGIRRPTMTGLLKRLEADQLVERLPDGADGRSVKIRLTRKGADLLGQIMPEYYSRVETLMCGLDQADVRTALAATQYLSAHVGKSLTRD